MKKAAVSFIALALVGGTYLARPMPDEDLMLPLPGRGLSVRMMPIHAGRPGNYHLEVWMPRSNYDDIHVVDETLPCKLKVGIDEGTSHAQTLETRQLKSYGEYGWARVVLYRAEPGVELDETAHTITVSTAEGCEVVSVRGAAAIVAKDQIHHTERYLMAVMLDGASKAALFVGLIGATIVVLRSKNAAT